MPLRRTTSVSVLVLAQRFPVKWVCTPVVVARMVEDLLSRQRAAQPSVEDSVDVIAIEERPSIWPVLTMPAPALSIQSQLTRKLFR